jgi:uncharacterized caspase-like protein
MRRLLTLLALIGAMTAWPLMASAERRVALVIGNGAYQAVPALANPANDARALAAALERLGFDVVSGFDLTNADMRRTVRDFAARISGADVAFFFYAGHGLQVAGENYLLPVDADLKSEADLDFSALRMELVTRQIDREAKIKIVMLDACRDNPFEKQLARGMASTRSAALRKGLAEIGKVQGSMIAFATEPGDVAQDGDGKHSPFTMALLRHIETPGVEIGVMMRRVTKDVFDATREKQRPWTNASLTGEFYLKPGEPVPPAAPSAAAAAPPPAAGGFDERHIELALWQAADKSGVAADYEEYLKAYPQGRFAGMARNRLEALKGKPDGAPAAPPATAAPAAAAATEPPPWAKTLGGIWRGQMTQPGAGVFPVEISLPGDLKAGAACGGIFHISAQCVATLRCMELQDRLVVVEQTIEAGRERCVGGVNHLVPQEDNTLLRIWIDPRTGREGGRAMLARQEATRSVDGGAAASDEASETQLALTPNDRIGIQRRLSLLGFDTRGVDGSFGPGTRGAVTAWQESRSFTPASGFLDSRQYQALIVQSEARYANWVAMQRRAVAPRPAAPIPQAPSRPASNLPSWHDDPLRPRPGG